MNNNIQQNGNGDFDVIGNEGFRLIDSRSHATGVTVFLSYDEFKDVIVKRKELESKIYSHEENKVTYEI